MKNKSTKPRVSFVRYLKPYWLYALISPIFMAGEVGIDLLLPKLMSRIVNEGVLGGDVRLILVVGLQMLGCAALGGAAGLACAWTASVASQGFGNDVRVDAYSRVMSLSLGQTDAITTGSLVTRLTNDITTLQDLVAMILRMFVRAPMFLVGGFVICLSLNVKFSYVVAALIPFMLFLVAMIVIKANPLFLSVQKKLDRLNAVVQENVNGARVVKAFGREEYEINRFDVANRDYRDVSLKVGRLMSLVWPFMMIVMNTAVVTVIYIGGYEVEAAAMNVGDVMAAATYITSILGSIMMVSMMFQQLSRGKVSADRVRELLASEPDITSPASPKTGAETGTVEFDRVSFSYPSASGTPVLSDISFKIKKGEIIAVIGSTGSGKTSLVSLIPRFYDVTGGSVRVDGVDVREWEIDALRSKIGIVLQKSELFSGTVYDNLRWGDPSASDEEVREAAKIAQADDFVSGFADGYNTWIAEKGASLSGGQKQRLAIARAILKKPEIIIFDDSTSALDLGTEARLQKALREKLAGTTVIMIAQRIASVRSADRIAVIENGRITAFDTHEALLRTSATYRDIYDSQVKSGSLEAEGKEVGANV